MSPNKNIRERLIIQRREGTFVWMNGKKLIDFASNNTLGLSQDPRISKTISNGIQQYGAGAVASPIVCGSTQAHVYLENAFCHALSFEKALCFNSGYNANLAVLSALSSMGGLAIDRQIHASVLDGLPAASRWFRYRRFEQILSRQSDVIFTEGVFSQTGRQGRLQALSNLKKTLVVDDAHGIGVLGENGLGSLELQSVKSDVAIYPMGKAFGLQGAVVCGSAEFIDSLTQTARPWIYSTALSPAIACGALKAFEIIQSEKWRREKLTENISCFKHAARKMGLQLLPSDTPIQSILVDQLGVPDILKNLRDAGFLVGSMRPPSVANALIRVVIQVGHNQEELNTLINQLGVFCTEENPIEISRI